MRNWMIGWKKSLAKTEKEAVTGGDQVSLIPTSRLRLHQTAKLPQVKKLMNSPLPLPSCQPVCLSLSHSELIARASSPIENTLALFHKRPIACSRHREQNTMRTSIIPDLAADVNLMQVSP